MGTSSTAIQSTTMGLRISKTTEEPWQKDFGGERARTAFAALRKGVDELIQPKCLPTNYVDKMVLGAIHILVENKTLTRNIVDQLERLYMDFTGAIQEHQPPPDVVEKEYPNPFPWPAPKPKPGQLYYLLPECGGYWVMGSEQMRDVMQALRNSYADYWGNIEGEKEG